jgi:hypothetical protein
MENNKAFTLTNEGKTSFFLLPSVLLDNGSQVQKEKKNDFLFGRVKKDVAPLHLFNEELYDVVLEYGDIVFGF